ncbi:MAG TPA: trypsin-like peptidase domain-containing protein [Streptosporangiaceae bacterium]
MTPHEPQKRSRRTLIALLLAVLGVAAALGGIAVLRSASPSDSTPAAGPGGDTGTAAAAKAEASQRPLSDRAVYDLISPSVVDITATLGYDDETASGTGFFVDPRDGLVLTNNHVIRDATSVTVAIPATDRTYQAQIVGVDTSADVAVLRILPQPGAHPAPIGDSSAVSVGSTVIAIGNRAGAGGPPVLAPGVISATGRTISAADGASGFTETLHNMLQTTAKIQPGDSGGPLADSAGTVIGVDTAAGAGGSEAGYAIPINTAMTAERQIASGRRGPGIVLGVGGFLGVIVPSTTAPSPLAQAAQERTLGTDAADSAPQIGCLPTEAGAGVPASVAPVDSGALVDGVLCGTAADAAGLTAGDVIITADGRAVSSPDALTAIVNGCRPGSVVEVTWVSPADATQTSLVRLDSAPAA